MTTEREVDAMANMMAADGHRVDQLVAHVGEVRGDMRSLRDDVARVGKSVDELRQAMLTLAKYEVHLTTVGGDIVALRSHLAAVDGRLRVIEVSMPALTEARTMLVRGIFAIVGMVGLALLALVIRR